MENSLVVLHLPNMFYEIQHIRKNWQPEDVYPQKSYFHFRFNTNSGSSFPMQSSFYLKPQNIYQISKYWGSSKYYLLVHL
jgi:hypothetical protein